MKVGVVGAGQFAGSFVSLWQLHPGVEAVYATDLIPERARDYQQRYGIARTFGTLADLLASDCDAVAVMTQRWHHGEHVLAALRAGKHVFSAVPMATTQSEIEAIVAQVDRTGLIYMMGETSYYNPAVIWARERIAAGDFGRVFYAEGDYVHDMDNGFYAAYRYRRRSGLEADRQLSADAVSDACGGWCPRCAARPVRAQCQLPRCGRRSR